MRAVRSGGVAAISSQESRSSRPQGEERNPAEIQRELVTALSQGEFQNSLISHSPGLLDLIKADGCAVLVDGKVASLGLVPSDERIRSLVRWLDKQSADGVYATNFLPTQFEPAKEHIDLATGLLALSVSRTPKDYVLWFRPELVQVARWAGNPHKPVAAGSDAETLNPRASFAAWEETVRFTAEPSTAQDIKSATSLRTSILEVILRALDLAMRERQTAQSRQDMLMAELDHRAP